MAKKDQDSPKTLEQAIKEFRELKKQIKEGRVKASTSSESHDIPKQQEEEKTDK